MTSDLTNNGLICGLERDRCELCRAFQVSVEKDLFVSVYYVHGKVCSVFNTKNRRFIRK
jgi:hypothetical protein